MEKEFGRLTPTDVFTYYYEAIGVNKKRVRIHILKKNILKTHYSEFIYLKNVDFHMIWPLYATRSEKRDLRGKKSILGLWLIL